MGFYLRVNLGSEAQLATQVWTVTYTQYGTQFAASTAAVLIWCAGLLPNATTEIDFDGFDVRPFALITLRRVAHSASYGIAVSTFTFKLAYPNLFAFWNRGLQFATLPTL